MADPAPSRESSPLTLSPHPLSDIFTDSHPPASELHSPLSSDISEIPSLRALHNTAGYRSGISASKSSSLQAGFDEGYSLGVAFGLRAGYILGVLEGLCCALNEEVTTIHDSDEAKRRAAQKRTNERSMHGLLAHAKQELYIESVFAKEWWGEDGIWKFKVEGNGAGVGMASADVTFEQVAEQHPLFQKWMSRVREEMRRLGIVEGRFEGKEWESGRIG